jgi:WD40 repeat protein
MRFLTPVLAILLAMASPAWAGQEVETPKAVPPPLITWHTLAFAPGGGTVASAEGASIKLWDVQMGKLVRRFTGHTQGVIRLTFSSDGKTLASDSRDRTIRLWDTRTGKLQRTLADPEHPGRLVGFAQSDQQIVLVGRDGNVDLWDIRTGKLGRTFTTRADTLSAALSPDGKTLAAVSGPFPFRQVQLWDVPTGKAGRVFHSGDFNGWYHWVTFSPDGKLLAGGGERVVQEGTNRVSGPVVTLWEVQSGKVKWTREPECGTVFGVSFAPDGRTLAGGGAGVVYWDTQTGKPQGLLKTEGLIDSCVFSRDGKNLVVADWKSSESAWIFRLSVWEVKTGKRIRQLKE